MAQSRNSLLMVAALLKKCFKGLVPRRNGFCFVTVGFPGGDFWKCLHGLEVGFAAEVAQHVFAARPGREGTLVLPDAPYFAKQIARGLLGLAK